LVSAFIFLQTIAICLLIYPYMVVMGTPAFQDAVSAAGSALYFFH
jgi:hypothetical protein